MSIPISASKNRTRKFPRAWRGSRVREVDATLSKNVWFRCDLSRHFRWNVYWMALWKWTIYRVSGSALPALETIAKWIQVDRIRAVVQLDDNWTPKNKFTINSPYIGICYEINGWSVRREPYVYRSYIVVWSEQDKGRCLHYTLTRCSKSGWKRRDVGTSFFHGGE